MFCLTRENARKLDCSLGDDLDKCVARLQEYKKGFQSVYIEFNGHKLYSCDVTLDSAYREVVGMGVDEYRDYHKQMFADFETEGKERMEKAIAKIPYWIGAGKILIDEDKMGDWEEYVEDSALNLYHGDDVDASLRLMTALDNDVACDEVEKILESQKHSGCSYALVVSVVKQFSKRGDEFANYLSNKKEKQKNKEMGLEY